jgi:hypothetical protein
MNHSCWNFTMDDLCPATNKGCRRPVKRKRSIVEHFEIPIAELYPREQVQGMFLSEPRHQKGAWNSWIANTSYWEYLVREQGFPVVKVKMVKSHNSTHISNCTNMMDIDFLSSLDYTSLRRNSVSAFS